MVVFVPSAKMGGDVSQKPWGGLTPSKALSLGVFHGRFDYELVKGAKELGVSKFLLPVATL